ncbi:leucine-rich repeat-containing protein 34-like [Liolophura sinensis]|uniref:leucine-rich repeat-containing protein 34-like n=1 Tax=Liolophura sinensis TaxID=3198878 RepID=UPI0031580F7F
MSDIYATCERYESTCKLLDVQPNTYVKKMLERKKRDEKGGNTEGESSATMYLYLAGNNKLLTDIRLGDKDVEVLCEALMSNLYISTLDLRYNNITDKGAEHIANLLKENVAITELNLMCNDLTEVGASYLAEALQENKVLLSIRLNGNKIGNKGGMYFAQALQVNTTLESLDLAETDLTIESIIALSTVLHNNKTLKCLNVNRPILFTHQEETTIHFANLLKVNRSLEELHLQKYDMRDFGATRLAENLMENFTLTYLDLSCNRITRDGMKQLAKVLKNNTALKVLDLGNNRLEDDGAFHLAEALTTYNTTLHTLVVVSNNIRGKGLCALADIMKVNSSLVSLFIWGNVLEESACIAFANLIDSGRLEPQNTDVKPYVVDGVTYLCELNNSISRHYYVAPSYGDDVPSWQPRGLNPRSLEEKTKARKRPLMSDSAGSDSHLYLVLCP